MIRKLPAYPIYLVMMLWYAVAFTTYSTLASLYRIFEVGLNPFELLLAGTILEASVFLFEVPTGVVADVRSRRLSVIIGMFVMGAGFMVEGFFPVLATVLVGQAIWGIGSTFISGAEPAWIADEHGEQGIGRVYLRGDQMHNIGGLIGVFIAVGLAQIALNVPLVVGGLGLAALGLFLIVLMPENNYAPVPRGERSTFRAMTDTFSDGLSLVRGRPLLVTIIAITVIWGAASEGFDRLSGLYMIENITFPYLGIGSEEANIAIWFGLIDVVALLISLFAVEIVRRRIDTDSHSAVAKTLLIVDGGTALMAAGFGLAGQLGIALALLWAYLLLRQLHTPLTTTWINQSLVPQVRATVFSMNGQADAIGQVSVGLLFGVIGTLISVRASILAVAVVLMPVLLLYMRALKGQETFTEEELGIGNGK